jgi:hypothetical protein
MRQIYTDHVPLKTTVSGLKATSTALYEGVRIASRGVLRAVTDEELRLAKVPDHLGPAVLLTLEAAVRITERRQPESLLASMLAAHRRDISGNMLRLYKASFPHTAERLRVLAETVGQLEDHRLTELLFDGASTIERAVNTGCMQWAFVNSSAPHDVASEGDDRTIPGKLHRAARLSADYMPPRCPDRRAAIFGMPGRVA